MWELHHSFSCPHRGHRSRPFLSTSFTFIFHPTPVTWGSFLSFLVPGGLLLMLSWCSVEGTVPSVDVVLMHLWSEINSMSGYYSAILLSPPDSMCFNLFCVLEKVSAA